MPSIINATTTTGVAVTGDNSGALALQTNNGTTAVTINTSQNTTFAQTINAPNTFGFKNRIINGAMVIDQRNAGASVTINSAAWTYVTDRFCFLGQSSDGVFTAQQSSTAPAGFNNSLLVTVTTADASIGANQIYTLRHTIEGFNTADLNWGTANAKTVTLSFWVRSSLTGTFGGALNNEGTRSYPFTYSISAANTWEYKTITITGDTSGTWGTTNSHGVRITWGLGVGTTYSGTAGAWAGSEFFSATGATSVVGTNGATFYITGVQLEVGSTATSFDYRPYGTELALCQRYYQQKYGFVVTTSSIYQAIHFPVSMRVPPTIGTVTFDGGTGATFTVNATYGYTNAYQSANHSTPATVTSFPLSAEL